MKKTPINQEFKIKLFKSCKNIALEDFQIFFYSVGEREQEAPYKLCALHCCTAKVLLIKSYGSCFFTLADFQWGFYITRIYVWPHPVALFLALWVWKAFGAMQLVFVNCNSLNNLDRMTIFGRNDTNTEGMTIVQEGHWRPRVKVGEGHGYKNEK